MTTFEKSKKSGLARCCLVVAVVVAVLGPVTIPQPVYADAIGVKDTAVYKAVMAVVDWLKSILKTISDTLNVLTDFKDLFDKKSDEEKAAEVAVGEAVVTAVQGAANAIVTSNGVVSSNLTLDLKNQMIANVTANNTPPANANYLCLQIKAKQGLFVLEQFAEAVANALVQGAMAQGVGPDKNAWGGQGAAENYDSLCGNLDGSKSMSALTGAPSGCQSAFPYVADAHIAQTMGTTAYIRMPKITVQEKTTDAGTMKAAVMVVDTSDQAQVLWAAVRKGFYLTMQHPTPPYGEALKTNAGKAAMTEYLRSASKLAEMGHAPAYKIGFNTAMNCAGGGSDPFSTGCKIVKDACDAVKAMQVTAPDTVDCDKGISLADMILLVSAGSVSNMHSVFSASAGMKHGDVSTQNDISGLLYMEGLNVKNGVSAAAATAATGMAGVDWAAYNKEWTVAQEEYRHKMQGDKAYGQNERQEQDAAPKHKVHVRQADRERIPPRGVTPIHDGGTQEQPTVDAFPAVLSR